MKAYLDILSAIKQETKIKKPFYKFAAKTEYNWQQNRTGIPTIGISGTMFKHDMANGFPLLTTKQMGLKTIATELEFFLQGITDKKWLQDRNCKIWNEWATPVKTAKTIEAQENSNWRNLTQQEKNKIADEEMDLGPIYGFQWRHFGGEYDYKNFDNQFSNAINFNPKNPGIDQVKNVIDKLHSNPDDRRMIVSAWNPIEIPNMALPPCHILHEVLVKNGKLHLMWFQRSCDMFLGIPYNIASYALMLKLYAKEGGFAEGTLTGFLGDSHIYQNHLAQVNEQLKRRPMKLPTVEIPDENWNGMLNWSAKDFVLKKYNHHKAIKGEVAR